jgi:uncharacterized protein YjbI with pentapeptide repeats
METSSIARPVIRTSLIENRQEFLVERVKGRDQFRYVRFGRGMHFSRDGTRGLDFGHSVMPMANFMRTSVKGTSFSGVDLTTVNLEGVLDLAGAIFHNTVVTSAQSRTIKKAFERAGKELVEGAIIVNDTKEYYASLEVVRPDQ